MPDSPTSRVSPQVKTSCIATLVGICVYVLVVLTPAIVATSMTLKPSTHGLIHYLAMMSGIVAYAVISMQFVLAAGIGWSGNPVGSLITLRLHKTMAVVATVLVLVHVGLLVWSRGNWNLVLNPWASWPIQIGRLAILPLITILVISFGRRWIPINNADWRWFHNALAWSILSLGFVHSMVMGTSFDNPLFAFIWTAYFTIAVLAWSLKRFYRTHRKQGN